MKTVVNCGRCSSCDCRKPCLVAVFVAMMALHLLWLMAALFATTATVFSMVQGLTSGSTRSGSPSPSLFAGLGVADRRLAESLLGRPSASLAAGGFPALLRQSVACKQQYRQKLQSTAHPQQHRPSLNPLPRHALLLPDLAELAEHQLFRLPLDPSGHQPHNLATIVCLPSSIP